MMIPLSPGCVNSASFHKSAALSIASFLNILLSVAANRFSRWPAPVLAKGYDGVVHILPFSCMPESVASATLVRVSRDYGIPVLTIHIDENTSPVRLTTQLEAFVDTLLWRRSHRASTAAA